MNNTLNNGVNNGAIGASVSIPYTIGTAGQFLTSGSNGTSWTTATGYSMGPSVTIKNDPATLEVKGKMMLNGQDLEERLKTIEKVLMIPERDVTLEAKYPSLKKKFDEYINALEKYKTFERIKGTYD
jgi:hypothetical protein